MTSLPAPDVRATHEAADWYAQLRGAPANPDLEHAWRNWLNSSEANQHAWQRVMSVSGQFRQVPGALAIPTLGASRSGRRSVLRGLALFAVAGGSGMLAYRQAPWQEWNSDFRTATGERRNLQLADGSSLTLNARSSIDVRFDSTQRLVRLHAGEILVTTHPDPVSPPRPFRIQTEHGLIRALGTRFNVRSDGTHTVVSVLEHAVEITPQGQPDQRLRIEAGHQVRFNALGVGAQEPTTSNTAAWTAGRLVVVDRPLSEVLAQLAPYRPGHLGWDPAVSDLRISGAFPLDDTDEALAALTDSFPLHLQRTTRYWVRVHPR